MVLNDGQNDFKRIIGVNSHFDRGGYSTGAVVKNYPNIQNMFSLAEIIYWKNVKMFKKYPCSFKHWNSSKDLYQKGEKYFTCNLPEEVIINRKTYSPSENIMK